MFQQLFTDYTLRTIAIGTILLGIVSGVLGCFAVLRKQSLLGDAVSHAALPGIAIAFMITGVKNPLLFVVGAAISGWLGMMWIRGITNHTRIKSDTALGIVLSVFFGFGLMLLTYIQKQPNANQAGLDKYLFGQAATLLWSDVQLMLVLGIISLLLVVIFWKEFKLLTFDSQYAQTLGFSTRLLDITLTSVVVIAIILGLQTVGVVLMSAMILSPAAAARQWTERLSIMVLLSALFGALAGLTGTMVSATAAKLSTGPVIVLASVSIVVVSFIFAPNRGLLFKQIRYYRNRRTLQINKTLSLMYELASSHTPYTHPHSFVLLNELKGFDRSRVNELVEKGLIQITPQNEWILTPEGYETAQNLYQTSQDAEE